MPFRKPQSYLESGPNRFKGLQLGLTVIGVLIIAALAGSSAYDAYRSYRYTIAANEREIANVANALAEQTAWSLQAVDLLLIDCARWYRDESHGMAHAASAAAPDSAAAAIVSDALGARAAAMPQVREVLILDAQGNPLFRSRGAANGDHNVADRSYFIAQRNGPSTGLYISEPLITRSEGRAAVVLSRRLDNADGNFAGAVIANVDLAALDRFYSAVHLGAGSAVQLLRDDGTLLVSIPRAADDTVHKTPDSLAVFAAVRNTPLRLTVTRDLSVVLRPWRAETTNVAVRTVIVVILGALGLAVLLRQINVLKLAQLDKERLEAQLRQSQKMEAIGTLAGGIAHDFNNVLGAILGYGELALQHSALHSDLRRYLDNVMLAAERAKLLVERILGFSRSGLGDLTRVNVETAVRETTELLEPSLPANIRLQFAISVVNTAVVADPTYLHQVTMNLCTNAVQAMSEGGVLRIEVTDRSVSEPRDLHRGTLPAGEYIAIAVSDTGAGIAPALLDRIFDPFFTTKRVGEGTGLGLSLVHGIVADLGGAIDVTSTPGLGTRFDVYLPAAARGVQPESEPTTHVPLGNGETVMVVDDEPLLVALAEEMLAQLGYEPAGYVSSHAALDAMVAAPGRFDVVLTDESMPGMMGTEFARQVRKLRPSVPIILMSGHAVAGLADRAASLGISTLLRKPLRSRDIAVALLDVLRQGATSEASECPN